MKKSERGSRTSATRTRHWRAALAFSTITTCASWAVADPTAEQREESREHFRLGNEAFARGENETALGEYQRAYVLARSFDIACNLGRVEYQLAMWPHAADHLGECLENFSASTRADLRSADARLSELFEEVRAKVALLRIDVQPERASVSVGTRSVLGPWPAKVYLLPGEHVVSATFEGRETETRNLTLAAGDEQVVHMELQPKKAEAAVPPPQTAAKLAPPSATPDGDTLTALRLPVLVAGGVLTAFGVGFGTYFLVQRGELADDADAKRRAIGGGTSPEAGACRESTSSRASECDELASTLDDGKQAEQLAVGGFVAGGVFALGTVAAYFLWPDSPESVPVRVEPRVGASVGEQRGVWGAALTGRF